MVKIPRVLADRGATQEEWDSMPLMDKARWLCTIRGTMDTTFSSTSIQVHANLPLSWPSWYYELDSRRLTFSNCGSKATKEKATLDDLWKSVLEYLISYYNPQLVRNQPDAALARG